MVQGRRKKRPAKKAPSIPVVLRGALTDDEYDLVVSAAFGELDENGRERLLSSLPREVAETVGDVLSGATSAIAPRRTSDRVLAEWRMALEGIESLASETGDENGTYVRQDEHREPPWLDLLEFCEDLEPFAKMLRSLLPRVLDEGLDPEFDPPSFLVDLEERIGGGLPDWIEPFTDDLVLGPELTGFLIDHAEIVAAGVGAFELAEKLLELDVVTHHLCLDRKALDAWFAGRSETDSRAITEGIATRRNSAPWLDVLESPRSFWSELARLLAARFDPALKLSLARSSMAGNPGLAGPVFRDLFERGEDEELLRLLPVAVSSPYASSPFDPEETLLGAGRHGGPGREEVAILHLLELARDSASRLDRSEVEAALEAQIAFLREPFDWERANAAIGELGGASLLVAQRFKEQWRRNQAREGAPIWTEDLLEAFFRDDGRVEAFAGAIGRRFADDFATEGAGRTRIWQVPPERTAIPASLALEVATKSDRRRHPALFAYLERVTRDRCPGPIRAARRRALKTLRAGDLLPRIIEWFRDRLPRYSPDPTTSSGNYDIHAAALAALRELDPASAESVLASWRVDHRRRRNLWAALEREGF